MEHSKDIICPDCGINTVSQVQFTKHGICTKCFRRKNMAMNVGKEYIKFIDLSKEEQNNILLKRDKRLKDKIQKKINKKQGKDERLKCKTSLSNNTSLHTFLLSHENLTVKEMLEEIHNTIPGCENLSEVYLRKLIERNGYKFKRNIVNNFVNVNNKRSEDKQKMEEDSKQPIATTRNSVYTQEVLDALNSLVTEVMTLNEIHTILKGMFPNKNITITNLCTRLNRYKIPYLKSKLKGKKPNTTKITIDEEEHNVQEPIKATISSQVILPKQETLYCTEDSNLTIKAQQELRLEPTKKEVETNLQNKFKELNCTLEKNYTTQDYINMLEMLEYLTGNITKIIKTRVDQHDVTNAYQQDVIHEMENTLAQPGDTYLSDKMHVLRDIRRYYEYDSRDITILKPLLETLDKKLIGHMKDLLNDQITKRNNIQFIPMVDEHLVNKYDWATNNTPENPLKRKQILRTNTYGSYKGLYDINMKDNKKAKKYRVNCKISGGGYGTFRNWYRDYLTINEDVALNLAQKDLKELSYKYPGMMYTSLEAHEINR